jgi:hypothetical protein
MKSSSPSEELVKYVFPGEIVEYFEIALIKEIEDTLHIYLDELNVVPAEHKDKELLPNGFYEESMIKDFPLRDKKVILHVRRRRWVDSQGKSHSREWELTAKGTRYSKEFAYFLKEAFGYLPDSSPIS